MRILVQCFVVAVLVGVAAADDGTIKGEFKVNMPNPVSGNLVECREKKGSGTLEVARCYEEAIMQSNRNISLHSSLSLLYLKSDMLEAARQALNNTVTLWLDSVQSLIEEPERGNTSYVDLLRRAYDNAKDKNDTALRDQTIEMGLVLAKKFELEHKPTDAHAIYYGFLLQLNIGMENVIDFHRRTGNVVALTHTGNYSDTNLAFRIAEAITPIVDGLTSHIMSYGQINTPIRRMCGISFTSNDEIVVRDLISKVEECVRRWGNYTQELDEEEPDNQSLRPYGVLKQTPLHRLAALNAPYLLNETLDQIGSQTVPADRFGRGLMHYAAAGAAAESIEKLIANGAETDKKDKGEVRPPHLGCTSPRFKSDFEKAMSTDDDVCDGMIRNRFEDKNIEETDDTGNDAGWNPGKKRKPNAHCDIDIRDASTMYQHDMNIAYMMANHPVVLRNAFFEEDDGPRSNWKRRGFNKTYHNVLLRKEVTPNGERYGIGTSKVVTVSEFLNTSKVNDGTIASVVVDNANHRLDEVASWVPPSLVNKKTGSSEVTYFDTSVSNPTMYVQKAGSKSHHHVKAYMSYHTVFYGHQEFTLLPPLHARTVRGQLPEQYSSLAYRCNLVTGDVLVVPELWSLSWVSKANGISASRDIHRKQAQD